MVDESKDLKLEINVSRIRRIITSREFWAASGFLAGNLTGFTAGMLMSSTPDEDDDAEYHVVTEEEEQGLIDAMNEYYEKKEDKN